MGYYEKQDGIYRPGKGEAYAFFDCNAPKKQIEDYLQGKLPDNSECSHDHPKPHELGLELKLQEVNELTRDRNTDPVLLETIRTESIWSSYPSAYKHLMASAKPTPLHKIKYAITAKNNKSNESVCINLATVMNDVYLKFGEGKPFTVAVLGKAEDGQYHPWTND
jgi:hypothetical protein